MLVSIPTGILYEKNDDYVIVKKPFTPKIVFPNNYGYSGYSVPLFRSIVSQELFSVNNYFPLSKFLNLRLYTSLRSAMYSKNKAPSISHLLIAG